MPTLHSSPPTSRTQSEATIRERFTELNATSSREAAALAAQGAQVGLWQLLFVPLFTFLQVYLWRGEWRRGIAGWLTALFASYEVFARSAKLWEIHHNKLVPPPP